MQSYKLRTHVLTSDLVIALTGDAECSLLSRETGKVEFRDHYHWFIRTTVKPPAMRARLRKHGLKGNASYSLGLLDSDFPIEYIAYMLKEGDITNNSMPTEIMAEATKYDKAVKADIKETRAKRRTILQRILDDAPVPAWQSQYAEAQAALKAYKSSSFNPSTPVPPRPLNVIVGVVTKYVTNWYVMNSTYREFQVTSTIQTILGRLFPEYLERLQDRMFQKILLN